MAFEEFLDFMPETVTIYPWASQDASTKPVYSITGVEYPARIEIKNRRIVGHDGREIVSRGRVFMGTIATIDTRDKVVLPSQYSPTSPPILAVNPVSDEIGPHHVVLEIG